MGGLADVVLPLIRTRTDLYRWREANAHGTQMLDAVGVLQRACETEDPAVVLAVTQKAIASALNVIMRADDSSGIIGDACRGLLDLHPVVAARARPPVSVLVGWMMRFQFSHECDVFTLDPVAYAPALGEAGIASYRAKLEERSAGLGPRLAEDQKWSSPHAHDWFTLDWNARRLAVLDRDVEAIIATHARDRRVAAWLEDTARALAEIGEVDLAIDWARLSTDFDRGHQSRKAADYWCALLAEHRPAELLTARAHVFERWPSSTTAGRLYEAAADGWPAYREEVTTALAASPRDAVLFALITLEDLPLAWERAHALNLTDNEVWDRLVGEYQILDPLAVLPVVAKLVTDGLTQTGAQHYRLAARRLRLMRRLAAGSDKAAQVDDLVAELRLTHRRRPRLLEEFDRAGLP